MTATADGFAAFRDEVVRHVPGLPATASSEFDITRHGLLDHVQRVLVRSYVLDRCPHLAVEAVEATPTLGALWELVAGAEPPDGDAGGLGRSATSWRTPRVRLAPLDIHHHHALYLAATDPIDGFRWRWRGRTPSPEEFEQVLFNGVKTQFVVESSTTGGLVGLVVAYDEDPAGRHCFIGFQRAVDRGQSPGGMTEGMGLFVSFLFQTFPYERLLLDMPAFNVPMVAACAPLVTFEGAISDYFSYGGRRWDRCFLSIHRSAWEPAAQAFFDDQPTAIAMATP